MNKKRYKYIILIVVCLCGASAGYYQYQLSPIAREIIAYYKLSEIQYSTVFSSPMIPAIFFSLIAGIIVDKVGAKRTVMICLLMAVTALWFRVYTTNYVTLYICMLIPGFAATFLNATSAKIFHAWFPLNQTSLAVGAFLASSALGMAIGTGTTASFRSIQSAFTAAAIFASVTAVLWFFFMSDGKTSPKPSYVPDNSILIHVGSIFRNRDIILSCLSMACIYGCYMILGTFLPVLLKEKGLSAVSAGTAASMQSFGCLVGCIVLPAIEKYIKRMKVTFIVLAASSAALTILLSLLPDNIFCAFAIFLIGMCIGGLLPLLMTLPIKIPGIGSAKAGTAGGLIATFQMIGAVVIPSYIAVPLSNGNTAAKFLFGAIICALSCVFFAAMSKNIEE